MSTRIPVLIRGAGIAGLTAALLLHRQGVDPVLVERRHPPDASAPCNRADHTAQ